jgi:hypothetical protein
MYRFMGELSESLIEIAFRELPQLDHHAGRIMTDDYVWVIVDFDIPNRERGVSRAEASFHFSENSRMTGLDSGDFVHLGSPVCLMVGVRAAKHTLNAVVGCLF